MNSTREGLVAQFRNAGNKSTFAEDQGRDAHMIIACIAEELEEFDEAAADYEFTPSQDTRAQLCKEWADLQYVVSQAALYYGIPADAAFNRVHNSNMTKVVDGNVIYREDGKILKPESYEAPNMYGL